MARQLNFDDEIGDGSRIVEVQSNSTENVEVLHPYSSLSVRRTTYDEVMNPPFTQGPPTETIVTLSSDEESTQASANVNPWGNHLIRSFQISTEWQKKIKFIVLVILFILAQM